MKTVMKLLAFTVLATGLAAALPAKAQTAGAEPKVTITTVMDNFPAKAESSLAERWGFSAAVVTPAGSTLFDAGPDGDALLANMKQLGLDPGQFGTIVISHDDDDHTNGLEAVLKQDPGAEVFLAGTAPSGARLAKAAGAKYHNVSAPEEVTRGIRTTGPIDSRAEEHALIVDTSDGLVVITGCAHPGIIAVLEKVQSLNPGRRLVMVMGGFHLFRSMPTAVDSVVKDFKRLKVEKVAPSHCSGGYAREKFKEVYGADYVDAGVGLVVQFDPPR